MQVLAYQRDQRYLRFYWTDRTEEEVRAFVQTQMAHQNEEPRAKFQLAVCLKPDGRLIGNCGIRMQNAEATEADIGYELAPEYWGNGYATEASRAIVAFGFDELKLHRLWGWCVADNAASANVLRKLGMQLEGRFREKQYYKERWWDTLQFAMLESEWRSTV